MTIVAKLRLLSCAVRYIKRDKGLVRNSVPTMSGNFIEDNKILKFETDNYHLLDRKSVV